jgi:hypothetical protein
MVTYSWWKKVFEITQIQPKYPAFFNSSSTTIDNISTIVPKVSRMAVAASPVGYERGKTDKQRREVDAEACEALEGSERDFTPHVKYGSKKPKMLHVHFYVDNTKRRFVVGHFGDHTDNFSTKTM